ncbi:hypothetical protein GCM10010167_58050 [Paractinoplanes deccanensis]
MLRDPPRLLDQRKHRLNDLPPLIGLGRTDTHAHGPHPKPAATTETTADTPSGNPQKHSLTGRFISIDGVIAESKAAVE